jgi:hypothetical protein
VLLLELGVDLGVLADVVELGQEAFLEDAGRDVGAGRRRRDGGRSRGSSGSLSLLRVSNEEYEREPTFLGLLAAAASARALAAASLLPKSSVKAASTPSLRSAVGAHLRSDEPLLMPPRKGPRSVHDLGGLGSAAMYSLSRAGSWSAVMLTPGMSSQHNNVSLRRIGS